MKSRALGNVACLIAAAVTLAGCSADQNSSTTGSSAKSDTKASAGPTTAATSAASSFNCASGTLNGEGSTAQGNAMSTWISRYQSGCPGTTINYNGTGSGAGIKQFLGNQVDWAGSDSALKPEEADAAKTRCGGNDAWNIPMAVGPIAVAYNLDGVKGLVLDGPTIAKIFTGKITKWDDDAIKALNTGASLPSNDIKVFFRADESGTTENFEKYLAAAGDGNFGAAPSKMFGGGVGEGQPKSAGVQQAVKATDGGIAYLEYSFARDANLGVAKISTGSDPIELTAENAGKALGAAQISGTGNDLKVALDYTTKAAGAYPIVLVTYEIVCSKGLDAGKTALLKSFLSSTSASAGQNSIADIGYGTLPPEIAAKVATAIGAIGS